MGIFSQWANPQYWLSVLYSLPAILLALSIHEAAHAFAAFKCGDPTARNLGRMTLDPTKHLDPIGTICLIFFRFGWAKPVPINTRNFKNPRRDDILVSLAGIISNFILSFISAGIYFGVVYGIGWDNEIFMNIMFYMIMINITLGVFNLLPIPPLDGSHVLGALLRGRAARFYAWLQRYGFIILLILLVSGAISAILIPFTNWLIYGVYFPFFSLFIG